MSATSRVPGTRVMLMRDVGGLCNRIFPFANALASCWVRGHSLVNVGFASKIGAFAGADALAAESRTRVKTSARGLRISRALDRVTARGSIRVASDSERLDLGAELDSEEAPTRLWVNALYVLDDEAFVAQAGLVRRFFRPSAACAHRIDEVLARARTDGSLLVGVHVRQGDYAGHDAGVLFYETPEYVELMRAVAALFPGRPVRFLVCSNVEQDPGAFRGLDWLAGPGSEISDLYALAGCDLLIAAPSTYAQWASFYGSTPCYVHDRKTREREGRAPRSVSIEQFEVVVSGFGRFVRTRSCAPELASLGAA